ncbi:MAG: hypothetical protein R2710_20450 [Acidimicrobiales bacterium]
MPAGGVRCARKILTSSATDLARTATYTFATFGHQVSGAPAGINAEGDDVAPAIANFVEELTPAASEGRLLLGAAKGVTDADLAPLVSAATQGKSLVASAAIHAAGSCPWRRPGFGGLDGKRVAIEGADDAPAEWPPPHRGRRRGGDRRRRRQEAVDDLGCRCRRDSRRIEARLDVTHQGAPMVKSKAIVPWGAIPVTTKAYAMLRRAGVTVVPDFISNAGSLLAGFEEGDDAAVASSIADQISAALDATAGHADGTFVAACLQAEAHLATWTDVKLFGRPLAA